MAPPPPGTGPATEKAHQGGASLTVQTAPEAGCPCGHPGLGRWPGKRGVSLVPGQVQAGPASLTAQGLPGVPGGLTPLCYLHAPGSGGPRSPTAATSALGFSVNGGRRLLPELQNLKALGFLGAALHHTPCQAQPPLGQPHFLLLEAMPATTFPGSSEPRPNHDLWASHLSHLPAAHCPQDGHAVTRWAAVSKPWAVSLGGVWTPAGLMAWNPAVALRRLETVLTCLSHTHPLLPLAGQAGGKGSQLWCMGPPRPARRPCTPCGSCLGWHLLGGLMAPRPHGDAMCLPRTPGSWEPGCKALPTGRNPGPLLSRAVGLRKRGSSWVRVEGRGPPCPPDTALL